MLFRSLRAECGADLPSFFTRVIPAATRTIGPVVQKYGFPETQDGASNFAGSIKAHASDPEIAENLREMMAWFVPTPVS